jgi:PsbN protein
MNFSALILALFLGSFLVSVTGYSFYIGFGPQSNSLRDPFLEHED